MHRRAWGQPWIVTFEYGGVGGVWEMVTDRAVLAEQAPRLRRLVKGQPAASEMRKVKERPV